MMLHACCGPCSLEPVRIFAEEGVELAIEYTNPNIHPREEYDHRLQVLRDAVCSPQGLDLFEGDYDADAWEEQVGVHGTDRAARCRACYRMRLEAAACTAEREGFDALSTTLTVSPYQFTQVIFEELRAAAAAHGLIAVCRDFREFYPQATRRSRAMGMYRQNYCGCRFSVAESERERQEREALKRRERAFRHRALMWAAAEGCASQANQL